MRRLFGAAVAALVGTAALVALPAAAGAIPPPPPPTTFCVGSLAPGNYGALVVPAGAPCFVGGPGSSTFSSVTVGPGAFLVIGPSFIDPGAGPAVINGSLRAFYAAGVVLHGVQINRGLYIQGGFGTAPPGCTTPDSCGYFSAIEDSQIHGGAMINGYNGFWLGFIRNTVWGGVVLANNSQADPDASEYVTNVINGTLACVNDSPAPHGGDSGGLPNIVTGLRLGQCFAGFELLP